MGNKIFLFLCSCCCKHVPEDDNDETNKTETNPYISIIDNEDNNETLKILIKKNKKNDSEVNDGLREDVLILNVEEKDDVDNSEKIISLGINIGALKTVYSIFSEINGKYVSNVLLMNNSSRIIPSIICYTKTHRLFGENSLSSLKQNLNTSYNNLSRIFGFDKNIKYYENEIKYQFNNNIKLFRFANNKEEIKSEYIIGDYLSLINEYYFEKENIKYDICSISVPDFYNSIQKQELKLICESIGMKNIKIINESSAITMYYGYTKYKDIFLNKENKIDPNIEKNILFIDAGHSKTSFILSKFKYNEFKVEYVLCDDNLGGRNFDELIFNYCIEEFKKKNKYETINVNNKMRYRLIESIKSARIKLTVNTETLILVDVFYNDIDLKIILTRQKFEELIIEYINKFKNILKSILNYSKKNNLNINEIELAGEIMRTPIFQRIIEDNKLKISKGILIDECCSVGAALLGNYINDKFIIQFLKNIIHYNYYNINYQIINNNNNIIEDILFPIGPIINQEKYININDINVINSKQITLKFFYINNENISVTLFEYNIDLFKILEENNGIKNNNIFFKIQIDIDQNLSNIQLFIGDKVIVNLNKEYYKIKKRDKKQFKNQLNEYIQNQKKFDLNYHLIMDEKMKVSKLLYYIKNIIQNNQNFEDEIIQIQKFDKQIREENKDKNLFENIEQKLNEINEKISNSLFPIKLKEVEEKLEILKIESKNKNEKKDEIEKYILECNKKIKILENEQSITIKFNKLLKIKTEINEYIGTILKK